MEVEDTGPALSEAARRRVFEPLFSRGEDPGRGLGLSVAHSIVAEQHQGNLSVRSSPGQGNCFVVRVPLRSSGTGQSAGFSKTA